MRVVARAAAFVGIGAALLLAYGLWGTPPGHPGDDLRGPLARVLRSGRYLEARLSISTVHSPCEGPATAATAGGGETRPGSATAVTTCTPLPEPGSRRHEQILEIAMTASERAAARPDADALWAAGLIELLWSSALGNPPDASIELLQEAVLLEQGRADLHADLAAAHLVRADALESPADLLAAIDAAERALAIDPTMAPALHNRALAFERLGLRSAAASAWERYAAMSSADEWQDEALRRARRLDASLAPPDWSTVSAQTEHALAADMAKRDPQGAREFGLDRALPEWAAATIEGRSQLAADWLALAAALGAALEDRSLAHITRELQSAGPGVAERIARAIHQYGIGRAHYRSGDFAAAEARFAAADRLLPAQAGPLKGWVSYHLAATRAYGGARAEAQDLMAAVLEQTDPKLYPALVGSALWAQEVFQGRRGQYRTPIEAFASAAELFERAGERENSGGARLMLAYATAALEGRAEALSVVHAALLSLGALRPTVWLHNALNLLAAEASAMGFPHAAVSLQTAGLEAARGTGVPVYEAEALVNRARLLGEAGRAEEAAADLELAAVVERRIDAASSRAWLRADRATALSGGADPAELAFAIDYFRSTGVAARLPSLLKARSALHLRNGRLIDAERDLEAALGLVRDQLEALDDPSQRASILVAAADLTAAMVALQLRQGRTERALRYVELGRSVGAERSPGGQTRIAEDDLAAGLDTGEVALVYALLDDSLAIWVLRPGSIAVRTVAADRREIALALERVRAAGSRGAGTDVFASDLERLWTVLIAGIEDEIRHARSLIVSPDPALAGAPFAALRNPATGRFLIETHSIRFAPALTPSREQHSPIIAPAGSVLLVAGGGQTRDRLIPGALPPLPGAIAEVHALHRLYPSATLIARAGAGADSVASALASASLAHFATHAVSDPERPDRSYLLVPAAQEGQPDGKLTAAAIRRLRLDRLRLVVLAACNTATPGGLRAGGFSALSDAFIAAGAGGVVGTLWQVGDRAAQRLMQELHAALARGVAPVEALADAQRAMIRGDDPELVSPAAWAGYLLVQPQ